jgi:ribose 1,5-bisphosphokinase PhnN
MKQILTRAEVPYLDVMIVPTSAGGNIDDRESVLRVIEERIKARNRGEGEREIHGRLKRARGFLRRSNEVSNILANEEGKQSSAVQSIIELINLQIYARTNQSEI